MVDKMLKMAGRGSDGLAKPVKTTNDGGLYTQTEPKYNAERYAQEEFIKSTLDAPLVSETLNESGLQWLYPFSETYGSTVHDFSGSGEHGTAHGKDLNLFGGGAVKYTKRISEKFGSLNLFSPSRGTRAVEAPNTKSFAGADYFTFQAIFETNDRKTKQMLVFERLSSADPELSKFSVCYNREESKQKVDVGLRINGNLIKVVSNELNLNKLTLLHVRVNLRQANPVVEIWINGVMDTQVFIGTSNKRIDGEVQPVFLGNVDAYSTIYRFFGYLGFFACYDSPLTPLIIERQARVFDDNLKGGDQVVNNTEKTVIYKDNFAGYYEIHVDDSILFLEELDAKKDIYTSIFDAPILKRYKEIHDKYGTVFNLSLFNEIVTTGAFGNNIPASKYRIGWKLDQMTDKFKSQFRENANWLKFSFHSQNYDIRYNDHPMRSAWQDYVWARQQVYRFAGLDSWMESYNKLHFYSANQSQMQEMATNGVHRFIGSAQHTGLLSYDLGTDSTNALHEIGHYRHSTTDNLYITGAGVVERILGKPGTALGVGGRMEMDEYLRRFTNGSETWKKAINFLSLETHEQWHFGDPEVFDQVEVAAKWFFENNYKPDYFDAEML